MAEPLIVSRPDAIFRGILVAVIILLVGMNGWLYQREVISLLLGVQLLVLGPIFIGLLFLRVQVFDDGSQLTLRMWPFATRHIPWADIRSVIHETGNPLLKAGGYGYRIGWKRVAFALSSPHVFSLGLTNGHAVLLTLSAADAETFRGLLTRHGFPIAA